ncbi:MAG: hypothetical protein ACPGJU_12240, partial [Coraliomargarita sp.]
LPKRIKKALLCPLHHSARRAYQGADKITAVGESYLDLAATYLGYPPSAINHLAEGDPQSSQATPAKPMHLCYHGTDLSRFQRDNVGASLGTPATEQTETPLLDEEGCPKDGVVPDQASKINNQTSLIPPKATISHQASTAQPLRAVYLGSMGQGYDLMTILKVAARWKAEGTFPVQIHFAG